MCNFNFNYILECIIKFNFVYYQFYSKTFIDFIPNYKINNQNNSSISNFINNIKKQLNIEIQKNKQLAKELENVKQKNLKLINELIMEKEKISNLMD